jgi:hypothetical protein
MPLAPLARIPLPPIHVPKEVSTSTPSWPLPIEVPSGPVPMRLDMIAACGAEPIPVTQTPGPALPEIMFRKCRNVAVDQPTTAAGAETTTPAPPLGLARPDEARPM